MAAPASQSDGQGTVGARVTAPSFSLESQTGQGYDAYDLVCCSVLQDRSCFNDFQWDLGEFDQKGTISTRWGAKGELLKAVGVAKQRGIDVIIDAVLNVCHTRPTITHPRADPNRSIRLVLTGARDSWRPQWIPRAAWTK